MTQKNIITIAGPGAGKTRRLKNSILEDLEKGVNPFSINAISFTKTAANEISRRTDYQVVGSTIHKLANRILSLASKSRGTKAPMVVGPEKAKEYIKLAIMDSGYKFVDENEALESISQMREMGADPKTFRPEIKTIWKNYRDRMVADNCIDLTGLLEKAARELKDESMAMYFSGGRNYLDEAQDFNPFLDLPIILELMSRGLGTNIFASPSQLIFDFRGSDWEMFTSKLPADIEIEYMRENHRSTPEIVAAGQALAGQDAKGMIATRQSLGLPVKIAKLNSPEEESELVALSIGRQIKEGVHPKNIAVLGRTWSYLYKIQNALRVYHIPYNMGKDQMDLYERPEVMALCEYIELALNPVYEDGLEMIINFPPAGIGMRTRAMLRGLRKLTWNDMIKVLGSEVYRDQVAERIKFLLDAREYLDEIASTKKLKVDEKVSRIIDISGISRFVNEEADFEGLAALEQIKLSSKEFGGLKEMVTYLRDQMVKGQAVKESVTLKTIHGSKGEEWDHVYLPGWNEGLLPLTDSTIASENRLAFVAVTRPRDSLVISCNKSAPASRFLGNIPAVYI